VRTTLGELRKLVREEREYVRTGVRPPKDVAALNELFGSTPDFSKLLDGVMDDLNHAGKKVEKAHELAPAGNAKAIVAGLHSDLFNKVAEFRKYVEQLKGMAKKGG
jgi:hypothetical protein